MINMRALYRQTVQEFVDAGLGATNDIIVKRISAAVPDRDLRDALEQVLYWNCATFIGEHRRSEVGSTDKPKTARGPAGKADKHAKKTGDLPQPSAKLANVRRHSDRCRRLLAGMRNVAPGVHKPLAACSPEELMYSIRTRRTQADGLWRTAAEDERRANRAIELGVAVIGDLDEEDLLFTNVA